MLEDDLKTAKLLLDNKDSDETLEILLILLAGRGLKATDFIFKSVDKLLTKLESKI